MRPPICAGVRLSLKGASATGHRPILVPSTSVSHSSARNWGSRSQRSSAVWQTPAGTPAAWSRSMHSYASRFRVHSPRRMLRSSWLQTLASRLAKRASAPGIGAGDTDQRIPLVVIKTGDRDPTVNALATISSMRRGTAMGRVIAGSLPLAPVHCPFENGLCAKKDARLTLRGVDALTFARHRAIVERAEQGLRKAIRAHPIEVGIAPPSRHRGLRQAPHMIPSGERAGDRPHRPQASVGSVAAHARLLHVDDVGADFALDVVAQPQPVKHAGGEALRDN